MSTQENLRESQGSPGIYLTLYSRLRALEAQAAAAPVGGRDWCEAHLDIISIHRELDRLDRERSAA